MGFWGVFFLVLFLVTLAAAIFFLRRRRVESDTLAGQVFSLQQALKKSEKSLSDSERRAGQLKAVSDNASDRLILVDDALQVLYINQSASDLFNQGGQKLVASPTLIAATYRHELEDVVRRAFADRATVLSQIALGGGTYAIVAEHLVVAGEPLVLLMFRDVSEVQKLGRARREMVANISHELRTPLTSIRLLVDTIRRSKDADPDLLRLIDRIAAETDTLHQLADELLDLSMIEAGRAEFLFTNGLLAPLADRVGDHLREQADRKDITLINRIPPDLAALFDATQVERVVRNLVHNAIKFSPAGGAITFEAMTIDDSQVLVSLMDEGPGIPDSEKERVFERFYRGDRSRNTPGTGLGLSIAKHIIQAHGGAIWVEDGPHLRGARFCFTLPRSEDGVTPES